MDVFLGGHFTTYGYKVLSISEQPLEKRVDPMSKVFPKVIISYEWISQHILRVWMNFVSCCMRFHLK